MLGDLLIIFNQQKKKTSKQHHLMAEILNSYHFKWEIYQSKGKDEGVRIEAEDIATKALLLKDISLQEIPVITQQLVDSCQGLMNIMQVAFDPQDNAVNVCPISARNDLGMELEFCYKTPFKIFSFRLLLEKQSIDADNQLEQIARSFHQQLSTMDKTVRTLQEENSMLKGEIQKLWEALKSPSVFNVERTRSQLIEWSTLGTKESLLSMISYLLWSGASQGGEEARSSVGIQIEGSRSHFLWSVQRDHNKSTPFTRINVRRDAWPFLWDSNQRSAFIDEAKKKGYCIGWEESPQYSKESIGYLRISVRDNKKSEF